MVWPLRSRRGRIANRAPALTFTPIGAPHAWASPAVETRIGRTRVDRLGRSLIRNRRRRSTLTRRGRPLSEALSTTPTRACFKSLRGADTRPRSKADAPNRRTRVLRRRRNCAAFWGGQVAVPRGGGSGWLSTTKEIGPTVAALTPVASKIRTL